MADTLTVLSSMATRDLLAELAALHGQETGRGVAVESVGGVEAARRVRSGERVDVVVLAAPVMAQLEAEQYLVPGSRTDVARSGVALAVREGEARPAIGSADAVKQVMLQAGRIGYSTGPSGDHIEALWQRWGIADAVMPRAVQARPGVPVAALLAEGKVDLGIQQASEFLGKPGIAVVGMLPPEIQAITVFTAGLGRSVSDPVAATALLARFAAPEAAVAKRRYGLESGG